MWILPLVGIIGSIVGFCFLTLAIGMSFSMRLRSTVVVLMACLNGFKASILIQSPLCAASGLYYLSELVEEHTVISKRLLSRLIYGIIVLDLLLCFVDRFPFWLTLFGIVSHIVYLGNMRRFPYVTLTDPLFLTSCGTLPTTSSSATLKQGDLLTDFLNPEQFSS